MISCTCLYLHELAQAFIGKGASTYLGWAATFDSSYVDDTTCALKGLQEQGFEPILPHDPESELIEAQEKLKQHQDFLEIQGEFVWLPAKYQEVVALTQDREEASLP